MQTSQPMRAKTTAKYVTPLLKVVFDVSCAKMAVLGVSKLVEIQSFGQKAAMAGSSSSVSIFSSDVSLIEIKFARRILARMTTAILVQPETTADAYYLLFPTFLHAKADAMQVKRVKNPTMMYAERAIFGKLASESSSTFIKVLMSIQPCAVMRETLLV